MAILLQALSDRVGTYLLLVDVDMGTAALVSVAGYGLEDERA